MPSLERELVNGLGKSGVPTLVNKCIHDAISENVVTRGNEIAIDAWDDTLSFLELEQLSTKLANRLVELGVGKESLVPLCFEKSAWAIISMLAVLKAGGAFVPLNGTHPRHRLAEIVEDTRTSVVVTSVNWHPTLSGLAATTLPVSRQEINKLPESSSTLPQSSPSDLAYSIFTSGSTGKPKGVLIEHRSFMSGALNWGQKFHLGPDTRFFQFCQLTFDVSIMEIFSSLIFGGRICIPEENDIYGNIQQPLARTRATHLSCAPSYLQLLSPSMLSDLPYLKTLILTGEMVHGDVVAAWGPHLELLVAYGPTEASVFSSITPALKAEDAITGLIGEPNSCQYWFVDPENRNKLVEDGAVGEMLIEGPIVARGYLHDEEKTKSAFLTGLEWAEPSRRFYATGDLVRRREDGRLVCLGRKDNQVKIRGIRIETSEIEHHIRNHWAERKWAVCVDKVESRALASALVAFISLGDSQDSTAAPAIQWWKMPQLRQPIFEADKALRELVPDIMVPALFVPLQRFPSTTSGKVDRKVLRELGQSLNEEQLHFLMKAEESTTSESKPTVAAAKPQLTETEALLAEAWAEVLRYPGTIGPDDSFFRLGGDSIATIKLSAAVYRRNLTLNATTIIRNPILKDMALKAKHVETNAEKAQNQVPPFSLVGGQQDPLVQGLMQQSAAISQVAPSAIEDIYPTVAFQTFTMAQSITNSNGYVSQFVFELPKDIDLSKFKKAWVATLKGAKILRTRCLPTLDQKGFVQVVLKEDFHMDVHDDLAKYLEEDRQAPMALGQPMSRYAVVLGDKPTFVWTMHHAVYDAFMVNLIIDAVRTYYLGGTPQPFVPFSHFLKGPSEEESLTNLGYWGARMANASIPKFPDVKDPTRPISADAIDVHNVDIARDLSSKFFVSTTIRAALALTLGQLSETNDILFIDVLSGRDSSMAGINRVLGPTGTPLPLRIQIDPTTTVESLLETVQQETLDRMTHQRVNLLALMSGMANFLPKTILDVRHSSTLSFGNELFKQADVKDEGGQVLGVPLLIACDFGDEKIEKLEFRWDSNIISSDEIATFIVTFKEYLVELSKKDRSVSLESLRRIL
ncbi:amino acid adenylation [Hypoxylon trugodes]|uniref:amino acid adenylation n=1 Tax=Hypoxylon trugodes TaxID=326681 RepID=UPI0021A0DA66|nr:amino acid adenylation [Hypoxylon trugodes]KAI1390763.1 amino acid adenylation [Hypoxylon trugodes]